MDISIYEQLWSMCQFHSWDYDTLLDMVPFEYQAIISMTAGWVETESLRQRHEQMSR